MLNEDVFFHTRIFDPSVHLFCEVQLLPPTSAASASEPPAWQAQPQPQPHARSPQRQSGVHDPAAQQAGAAAAQAQAHGEPDGPITLEMVQAYKAQLVAKLQEAQRAGYSNEVLGQYKAQLEAALERYTAMYEAQRASAARERPRKDAPGGGDVAGGAASGSRLTQGLDGRSEGGERRQVEAAVTIQRHVRGRKDRKRVESIRQSRRGGGATGGVSGGAPSSQGIGRLAPLSDTRPSSSVTSGLGQGERSGSALTSGLGERRAPSSASGSGRSAGIGEITEAPHAGPSGAPKSYADVLRHQSGAGPVAEAQVSRYMSLHKHVLGIKLVDAEAAACPGRAVFREDAQRA